MTFVPLRLLRSLRCFLKKLGKASKKKREKSGQADQWPLWGRGGHPPPAWPLLFVKILGLFTHWIWFIDTQNRFYFIVKRLKNACLMYFWCPFNCHKHPCAISFFRVHTILHDILGFDMIITRYYSIFLIWSQELRHFHEFWEKTVYNTQKIIL